MLSSLNFDAVLAFSLRLLVRIPAALGPSLTSRWALHVLLFGLSLEILICLSLTTVLELFKDFSSDDCCLLDPIIVFIYRFEMGFFFITQLLR